MSPSPRLLVSLHDVTPYHRERIDRAEALYRELGLAKVAYLLVPDYHGKAPAAGDAAFRAWCLASRPFAVEWHLHGYRHLEDTPGAGGGAADALKRRYLTAGEGEFLALGPEAVRERLAAGLEVFRACLGEEPAGFVAPAWLSNGHLLPALRRAGIRHTEDHRRLYRTDRPAPLPSPVITWATRTVLRKYGSLVVCPLLARAFARAPYLRVAMHPLDFDHPVTVRNIRKVLQGLMRGREQAFVTELEFP